MNLGAFMEQLGGRMDEWRAALVDEAFDRLDESGDGHLSLDKVLQRAAMKRNHLSLTHARSVPSPSLSFSLHLLQVAQTIVKRVCMSSLPFRTVPIQTL